MNVPLGGAVINRIALGELDADLRRGLVRLERRGAVGIDLLDLDPAAAAARVQAHGAAAAAVGGELKVLCSPQVKSALSQHHKERLSIRVAPSGRPGDLRCLASIGARELAITLPATIPDGALGALKEAAPRVRALLLEPSWSARGLTLSRTSWADPSVAPWQLEQLLHYRRARPKILEVLLRDARALAAFSRLEVLGLPGQRVDGPALARVAALSSLRALYLDMSRTDTSELSRLANLGRLEHLSLIGVPVTAAQLHDLARLPALRHLQLAWTGVDDGALAHLRGHGALQELGLKHTRVGDAGLANLVKVPLEELDLRGTRVTDAGMVHLQQISSLRRLWLPGSITDAGLRRVGRLARLQELVVEPQPGHPAPLKITDAGLHHLARLRSLRSLRLSHAKISDAGMRHLGGLKQLRRLDLTGAAITDAGLAHLTGLRRLRQLDLRYTRITPAGLRHLAGLVELRNLHLPVRRPETGETTFWGGGDEELAHLAGLSHLQGLSVLHWRLTSAGLTHIAKMTRLRHLVVGPLQDAAFVDDAGLCQLMELRALRRLDVNLKRFAVTPAGISCLSKLPELHTLNTRGDLRGAAIMKLARLPALRDYGFNSHETCYAYAALRRFRSRIRVRRICKSCCPSAVSVSEIRRRRRSASRAAGAPIDRAGWRRLPLYPLD